MSFHQAVGNTQLYRSIYSFLLYSHSHGDIHVSSQNTHPNLLIKGISVMVKFSTQNLKLVYVAQTTYYNIFASFILVYS